MASTDENPLLTPQNAPHGVPAFDKVKVEHYLPAFDKAIAENEAEVVAIANNPEAPTFASTVEALDRAGALLESVAGVFYNVLEADGND
jgi:peptidyl-dipeptidase Dcp